METGHGNTIMNDGETFPLNTAAKFSFLVNVIAYIHGLPHERQPSVFSPPKKSVNSSVVESANCVDCQTSSRAPPRRKKKVPPDIAVNAKTPSGYFALVLTTHFNGTMKGGASNIGRHVTKTGLTQPLQQKKAPPEIYVDADSFPKMFAMCSNAHSDVTMKGGASQGRSQPKAFHAGIRTTGPDMIGAGTCFGRKTESWGDLPVNHLKFPANTILTVALYDADDDFSFHRIRTQNLNIRNNGSCINVLQKWRQTKCMAVPNAHLAWNFAIRILETVGRYVAWIIWDDGTILLKYRVKFMHLAAGGGNFNNYPKFSERE